MNLRQLLLVSLATCPLAMADPAWKNDLSPAAPGPYPPLASSVLDLAISWKGIVNSGKLRIEFAPKNANKPGTMVIRSSAISLGPAAVVFPYQAHSWSELDPASLAPRYFHSVETDKRETIDTTTRYFDNHVETLELTGSLDKKTTKRSTRSFDFAPVFDIYSAILHVRSQKLDQGDQIKLIIHPFNNPYLLHVKVLGRENHLDRKTIRLSVGLQKISRKSLKLKPYKKIKRDATLWLSDDADRIPVELRADVFIGDIRATLTSFRKS